MRTRKLAVMSVAACLLVVPAAVAQNAGAKNESERAMPATKPDKTMRSERAMSGGAMKPASATTSHKGKSERAMPETNKTNGK